MATMPFFCFVEVYIKLSHFSKFIHPFHGDDAHNIYVLRHADDGNNFGRHDCERAHDYALLLKNALAAHLRFAHFVVFVPFAFYYALPWFFP